MKHTQIGDGDRDLGTWTLNMEMRWVVVSVVKDCPDPAGEMGYSWHDPTTMPREC